MTTLIINQLILIRHARTDYDRSYVPPVNPPLDETANHNYAAMQACLPKDYRWIISPLKRCQDTADQLIRHGASYASKQDDARLQEQSYGQWHDQNVSALWQDELSQGDKHNWHFIHPNRIPPDGESFAQVMTRLAPALPEYAAKHTVLVTHGMVIRALIGLAMGMTADQALALDIAPLSMTGLSHMVTGAVTTPGNGGRWQLNYLNRGF